MRPSPAVSVDHVLTAAVVVVRMISPERTAASSNRFKPGAGIFARPQLTALLRNDRENCGLNSHQHQLQLARRKSLGPSQLFGFIVRPMRKPLRLDWADRQCAEHGNGSRSIQRELEWRRVTVALRRQRSHVRIVSGAPINSMLYGVFGFLQMAAGKHRVSTGIGRAGDRHFDDWARGRISMGNRRRNPRIRPANT